MIEAMLGGGVIASPLPDVWVGNIVLPQTITSRLASTIFNDKIYIEGGNFFKVYDITAGTLTDKTPKANPTLLFEQGSLLIRNGYIYRFSGANANNFYEPEFVIPTTRLNVANNATSWTSIGSITGLASPGDRFQGAKGVIHNGIIYTLGGQYKTAGLNTSIYQVGVNGGAISKTDIERNFLNGTLSLIGDNAYYIGGNLSRQVVRILLPGKAVTELSPAPKASFGHCAAVYNDKIYVYGGGFGRELWEYNPVNDGWNLYARGGPGGTNGYMEVYQGKAYIFYGNKLGVAVLDPAQLPL